MPKFARPNSYTGKQSNQHWTGDSRAATAAEAAAGVADQIYISPATLASAVGSLVPSASATVEGVVFLTEGTSSIAYPVATKFYADNLAIAGAPAWSETVSGIGQLSTAAEAVAGTNDNTAMTPLKVADVFAAPPAAGFGSTTPRPVFATTLDATGLATLNASATIVTGAVALNLGADASTGAVNIGTGAGARVITVGNVTGATAVAINTGTGHFTVTTTGTGDIILNSDDTMLLDADGVLELNSSAGVISIGNDADAQNINIGTGAAQRVITIGNSSSATQVVINSGTAGVNIAANAIAQTVTIGNQTGASAVVIDSGTGPINIGTTIAKTITIGNVTAGTALVLNSGTGGVAINTTGAGDMLFNSADTVLIDSAGVLELNSSAGVIGIGNDAVSQNINLGTAGTRAIAIGNSTATTSVSINTGTGSSLNLGTNAIAHVVTIGNVTGATGVTINTGTAGFAVNTTGAGDVVVTSADTVLIDSAGVLELNSSAGVIGIGNDAVAQNINIGTGAAARIITLGNSTGATQVVINGGTAGVTLGANAIAQTVVVGNQTGASAVTIDSGTGAINIGTAIAKIITIGNVTGATAVNINTGTAGSTITTTNGILTIATGTGAITVSADAAATTILIGTGAAAKTLTIGSTNTTSTTVINAGSGDVKVTGANLRIATTAKGLQIKAGAATDFAGSAILVLGTIAVLNTNIATGDLIYLSRVSANGAVTLGELSYTISNGVSFTINSLILGTPASIQTADVSTVAYFIVRPL